MAVATAKTRRLGLAVMGLGLALALAFAVGQARADDPPAPTPVTTGAGLDWGIKASFRSYIEGPIAGGEITVSEGVTRNPDGSFHFPIGEGAYDPAEKALTLRFDGSVHMEGHGGILNMTVRDPRVVITPEETSLYAKVASRPLGGEDIPDVADVLFGSLDITGVEPVVAAGTTTWAGVPASVATGAVGPFAGHYPIGTAIDPLSFSYDGEGGKPESAVETWTEPGSRVYDEVVERTFPGSPSKVIPLAYDSDRGLLHVWARASSYETIQAFDPETLEPVGAPIALPGLSATPWKDVTYDEPNGALLLRTGAGSAKKLWEVRWDEGAETYQATEITEIEGTPIPADISTIRYDEVNEALYGLIGRFWPSQGMFVAHRDGASWGEVSIHRDPAGEPATENPFPAEKREFSAMAVLTDGTVVLTASHMNDGQEYESRMRASVVFQIDKWGGVYLFEIPHSKAAQLPEQMMSGGTGPPLPTGLGYTQAFAGPGNRLYLVEPQQPQRVLRLRKAGWEWTVLGEARTDVSWSETGVVGSDNTLFLQRGAANSTSALSSDRIIGEVPQKGAMVAGPNGSVFIGKQPLLMRVEAVAVSPTITDHPENGSVGLAVDQESAEVTFAAAASGTPAPAIQWQTRPPGAKAPSAWQAIEGETGPTLTVGAHREDSGRQYRAIFRNEREVGGTPELVGEIATDPATLTVDYAPSIVNQPEDASVLEGTAATFKVMPAGAPYPEITWQRRVGGYWQSLDEGTGDFEVDGGLLTVVGANTEMDGSFFRARVVNSAGAVNSRVTTLEVESLPPSTVIGGYLDWGVKTSFRNYIKGPIAKGSYEASAGAALNPDGTARFAVVEGSYDTIARSGEVTAEGTVRFSGHDEGAGPKLDLTIADPRLLIQGKSGTLFADVQSKSLAGGTLEQFPDIALATLDLSGAGPSLLGKALRFSPVGATLTTAGAPAFAAFYPAGTALDPLTLTAEFDTTPVLPQDPPPAQVAAAAAPGPAPAPTGKRAKAKAKHKRKGVKCKRGKRRARAGGKARCAAGNGKR